MYECITLGFAENGQLLIRKALKIMLKLSRRQYIKIWAKVATNQLKISQKFDLDSFQGID